LTLAPKPVALL